jgi:hypothetical protein
MSDTPPQQKLCPSCGTSVIIDANVCSKCGYNFNSGAYSQPPAPAHYNPAPRPGQYGAYGPPNQGSYGGYNQGSYIRPGYDEGNTGVADALAIASLILGILSIPAFCIWFIALPAAGLGVILGAFGLRGKFRALAISGMICGGMAIILAIVVLAWAASLR